MFKQARLKLTAWYLAIIMFVSLMFSAAIYRATSFEIERLAERQRMRWQQQVFPYFEPVVDEELIAEMKRRILLNLGVINLVIMVGSGGVGYYLAGKTLEPIAENMESQAQFISDASHELKTPITAIRTGLEVSLREKSLDEAQTRKLLNDNLSEVIRLQNLAEGLLELSRDKEQGILSPTPLHEAVEEAIAEISSLAKAKNISISLGRMGNRKVLAEKDELKRLIVIVLDNAIKYSSKKSEINVRTKTLAKETVLEIEDHGIGIAKSDLPHIIDRFYRAEKSRSTNGYGLGLAIANKIIQMHHGKITFESKVGFGTTVALHFPHSAKVQALV